MYKVLDISDTSIDKYHKFPYEEFESIEQVKQYLSENREKNFHVHHPSWGRAYIVTRFWFGEDPQYMGKDLYSDAEDLMNFLDNLANVSRTSITHYHPPLTKQCPEAKH